jgi:uncharacterized protein (TIGR02265 family)
MLAPMASAIDRAWTASLKWPEPEQRERRLPLCRPEDTIRGMYLGAVIERTRRGGHPFVKALAEAGLAANDEFAAMGKYPLSTFIRLQTACARLLETEGSSFEESVSKLGRAALDIFFESLPGRTFRALAGKDPHRMMAAAPAAYGLAISDSARRTHVRIAHNIGQLAFQNDLLGPCHQMGVFVAALEGTGKTFRFELEQSSLTDFVVRAIW